MYQSCPAKQTFGTQQTMLPSPVHLKRPAGRVSLRGSLFAIWLIWCIGKKCFSCSLSLSQRRATLGGPMMTASWKSELLLGRTRCDRSICCWKGIEVDSAWGCCSTALLPLPSFSLWDLRKSHLIVRSCSGSPVPSCSCCYCALG